MDNIEDELNYLVNLKKQKKPADNIFLFFKDNDDNLIDDNDAFKLKCDILQMIILNFQIIINNIYCNNNNIKCFDITFKKFGDKLNQDIKILIEHITNNYKEGITLYSNLPNFPNFPNKSFTKTYITYLLFNDLCFNIIKIIDIYIKITKLQTASSANILSYADNIKTKNIKIFNILLSILNNSLCYKIEFLLSFFDKEDYEIELSLFIKSNEHFNNISKKIISSYESVNLILEELIKVSEEKAGELYELKQAQAQAQY